MHYEAEVKSLLILTASSLKDGAAQISREVKNRFTSSSRMLNLNLKTSMKLGVHECGTGLVRQFRSSISQVSSSFTENRV